MSPMPVPPRDEAVRFLNRLCEVAKTTGDASTMATWITFPTQDGLRVTRRYVSRTAINEGMRLDDLPHDIFTAYYPGSTEDLYLDACLGVVKPLLVASAQAEAVRLLNSQETVVGQLQLQASDQGLARAVSDAAKKVKERLGQRSDKWGTGHAGEGSIAEFTPEEWKAIEAGSRSGQSFGSRAVRATYMRLVSDTKNVLLTRLMTLPNGVDIVDAFNAGPTEGRALVGKSLESCATSIRDLRAALTADSSEVWKYPPALGMGAQSLAKKIGRPTVAANLTRLAAALSRGETGKLDSVFGVLNVAVLLLLACGPIGAIVADVLAVVLVAAESAVAVVKEVQQDQAAIATTFADGGQKLSAGGRVGVAAVKGVLAIGAAVMPLAVGRIVGKASAGGRVAKNVEGAAVEDTERAALKKATDGKGTGDAARMTDGKQVSGKIADEAKTVALSEANGKQVSGKIADEAKTAVPSDTHGKQVSGKVTDEAKTAVLSDTHGKQVSGNVADEAAAAVLSDTRSERTLGARAQKKQDKLYGSKGTNENLDAEWESMPMRKFETGEVKAAKDALNKETLSQIKNAERRATVAKDLGPLLEGMVGTESQMATCDRVLGRMLGGGAARGAEEAALRAAGKLPRAEVVAAANKNADNLVRHLRAHWDDVVSPRGSPSAVARRVYAEAIRDAKSLAEVNALVRERLFGSWRGMFFTSIRGDPELVTALREQAGIHLSESGSNFYIELYRVPENSTVVTVENVEFNLDHAGIRLSDAVIDALKTGDSGKLLSTINSKNLSFLLKQENTRGVEVLRRDNRFMWNYGTSSEKDAAILKNLREVPQGTVDRGTGKAKPVTPPKGSQAPPQLQAVSPIGPEDAAPSAAPIPNKVFSGN